MTRGGIAVVAMNPERGRGKSSKHAADLSAPCEDFDQFLEPLTSQDLIEGGIATTLQSQPSHCSPPMMVSTCETGSLQPLIMSSGAPPMHQPHHQQHQAPSQPQQAYDMAPTSGYDPSMYYQLQPQAQQPSGHVQNMSGFMNRPSAYSGGQTYGYQTQSQMNMFSEPHLLQQQPQQQPQQQQQQQQQQLLPPMSSADHLPCPNNSASRSYGSLPSISVLQQPLSAEVFKPPDTQINRLLGDYLNPDGMPSYDLDVSLLGPEAHAGMYSKRLCLSTGFSGQPAGPPQGSQPPPAAAPPPQHHHLQQQPPQPPQPPQPSPQPPPQHQHPKQQVRPPQSQQITSPLPPALPVQPRQPPLQANSSLGLATMPAQVPVSPTLPPAATSSSLLAPPASAPPRSRPAASESGGAEGNGTPGDSALNPRRRKRFMRTVDALQKAGLMEVTMKTAKVLQQTQSLQRGIDSLRRETDLFIESVLSNPENQRHRDLIMKAFAKCATDDRPAGLTEASKQSPVGSIGHNEMAPSVPAPTSGLSLTDGLESGMHSLLNGALSEESVT